MPKDFFISYTKADLAQAEWITGQLELAGYSTTLQAWDFFSGQNFVLKMHEASRDAKRTIILLSPAYLTATFTQAEWAAAFYRDPTGEKGTLLPIHIRECRQQLTGLLGPIAFIDLVGLSEKEAQTQLLRGVKRESIRPKEPPPFPGF